MSNWILGDKFYAVYPHKNSIKGLWESKWKFAVCTIPTMHILVRMLITILYSVGSRFIHSTTDFLKTSSRSLRGSSR